MNRWLWFTVCALGGLVLLVLGLLMPIHLRAVDTHVIQKAGERPPHLIDHGLILVRDQKLGAARMLMQATTAETFPDREKLRAAIKTLETARPALILSGGDASPAVDRLFASDPMPPKTDQEPLTDFVIRLENREVVLEFLRASPEPSVQELLRCRNLVNTLIFSPSSSASGQPFDAAIYIAALLLNENRLTPHLRDTLVSLASNANHGSSSQPLEEVLLDFLSLGQRYNWGQLASFVAHVEDSATLHSLSELSRRDDRLPILFSAVELTGQPGSVVHYLSDFSLTGLTDLGAALPYGAGGVSELVHRDQRLSRTPPIGDRIGALPPVRPLFRFTVDCARWTPRLALAFKWLFYIGAGFLIAASMHFARPAVPALELPLQVEGLHFAREALFAMGFLLTVLLLSEPFIGEGTQKAGTQVRAQISVVTNLANVKTITQKNPSTMNQPSQLLTLLLFFVLQGLLFLASLVKLAEIRRQLVPARIKLKLLENEEHLFDAGLYLGFCGTIVSFILGSLHLINGSLMGAYSSTAFGIVFVSCFKIFKLRPVRRHLLMEAESAPNNGPGSGITPIATPAMTTP